MNKLTHEALMREAIRLSIENVNLGVGGPFAALVARDGEIIATGTNQVTTLHDPTAHAEVSAIRTACRALQTFELRGCDLYTTCEPCPMCLGAIYWARLERLYFGNTRTDVADIGFDDAFIYNEIPLDFSARKIPTQQLLRDDALAAFRAWQHSTTKKPY
jgi:tRNA(Arg) A34 adenosine deaminase TadA